MKIELEIYETEPDTPPRRLGFCAMKSSRTEICGARIMSDDIEWVELQNKQGYICGSCCDSLIASIFRGRIETLKVLPKTFRKGAAGRMWAL